MSSAFRQNDKSVADVVSALLQSDAWVHGGIYVIEIILATKNAINSTGIYYFI